MLVTLEDGFQIEVKENAFDDMETLDILVRLDEGDAFAMPKLCNKIFISENKKKIYDHCRSKDGRVPIKEFTEIIRQIMTNLGDKEKN